MLWAYYADVNTDQDGAIKTFAFAKEMGARTFQQERGDEPGPLFQTRTGKRFSIQQVDYVLKKLAGQANATLPAKEHIDAHPHILRHTMLRKVREEKGLEYAIEYAGHVSEKYIRRYTMPSEQETESVLEELFG